MPSHFALGHRWARELDVIRVVGRSNPVKIYELLDKSGHLDETWREMLISFNKGFKHYQAGNWQDAIACFKQCLVHRPEDGPSLTFIKRCEHFLEEPPAEDWDGVFEITTK